MSQQQRLERERAEFAWRCLMEVKNIADKAKRTEYGSLARSAPSDIQSNGLGQTVAFWRAKAKNDTFSPHAILLKHVEGWLALPQQLNLGNLSLLQWIIQQAETDEYLTATSEALAILVWVKRFAEAELS